MKQENEVDENQHLATQSGETLRAAEADGQPCVAGRELDALVAERVMQWKRVRSDRDEGDDRRDVAWMLHYKMGVLRGEPYTYGANALYDRTFRKWSPSTDIAAAMEVIEKMRELGWLTDCITNDVYGMPDTSWSASFRMSGGYEVEAQAATLPEAICRAALQPAESSAASNS
jgi:hypothetical protein